MHYSVCVPDECLNKVLQFFKDNDWKEGIDWEGSCYEEALTFDTQEKADKVKTFIDSLYNNNVSRKNMWNNLKREFLRGISEIDKNTPYNEMCPEWWKEMHKIELFILSNSKN